MVLHCFKALEDILARLRWIILGVGTFWEGILKVGANYGHACLLGKIGSMYGFLGAFETD